MDPAELPPVSETLDFLGIAPTAELPPKAAENPSPVGSAAENPGKSSRGSPQRKVAKGSPPWPSLSLELATPLPRSFPLHGGPPSNPPPDPAFFAALQGSRLPPPEVSHPQALRAVLNPQPVPARLAESARLSEISRLVESHLVANSNRLADLKRLAEPKFEPRSDPVLLTPGALPVSHAQRFSTPAFRGAVSSRERTPLEHNLASGLDVRDMIDALVVERLRDFTHIGGPALQSASYRGLGTPPEQTARSPTSDQEGASGWRSEWSDTKRGVKLRDGEGGGKREPLGTSDVEEGPRRKRGRSRSRSSSPHEAQGGTNDRVGGNREAVRKYREKKKVEFASMQNQLAQLHKRVAQQEEQLRRKAGIEGELVHLWRQVGALQEKVSHGHNLLVSELFAIKPPPSLSG